MDRTAKDGGGHALPPWARTLALWAVAGSVFGAFNAVYWPLRAAAPPVSPLRPFQPDPTAGPFGLGGWAVCALAGLTALLVTAAATPLCRRLALRLDVLDHPTESRKVHGAAVPYLGGLAMHAAFLSALLSVQAFAPAYSHPLFYPAAAVGTAVLLLGLADDAMGLPSWLKLAVELGLGVLLYHWGFGVRELQAPLGGVLHVGWLAVAVAALWLAGLMNAVNFIDGLDGLAAGLIALCAATLLAVGLRNGQVISAVLMAGLLGAAAGFLLFNFHPASIFMGDAGALFLGFVLAAATLVEEQKGAAVMALAVPMTALAVPLADTVLSFIRRLRRAREGRFFEPDRRHLHHRLLALGLGHRGAVLALYAVSAVMAPIAWVVDTLDPARRYPLLLLPPVILTAGVVALRYFEGRKRVGVAGTSPGPP